MKRKTSIKSGSEHCHKYNLCASFSDRTTERSVRIIDRSVKTSDKSVRFLNKIAKKLDVKFMQIRDRNLKKKLRPVDNTDINNLKPDTHLCV